jgi:signal transduction histidine kinase
MVEVSVTDSGIGIPASAIEKVLKPFQQADPMISRKYGSTSILKTER